MLVNDIRVAKTLISVNGTWTLHPRGRSDARRISIGDSLAVDLRHREQRREGASVPPQHSFTAVVERQSWLGSKGGRLCNAGEEGKCV